MNNRVLILDIGNTRLKWGIYRFSDGKCVDTGNLPHKAIPSALSVFNDNNAADVWISSVADVVITGEVMAWFNKNWGLKPHLVETRAEQFGVVGAYSDYSKLGVDRWMAMLAAQEYSPHAFCVVDAGSAITVDCVDGNGVHAGGLILPGKASYLGALYGKTGLPVPADATFEGLAGNTLDAIRSGLGYCMRGIGLALEEFGQGKDFKLFLTGGDARWLSSFLPMDAEIRENLVLEGVFRVAVANDA